MKKIIISPYSRSLKNKNGNPIRNAKNFPYWEEVLEYLKNYDVETIQIGIKGEKKLKNVDAYRFDLSFDKLKDLIKSCYFWISVDNFLNHFGTYCGKKGIVIFSKSDPEIFGYDQNINILKNRKYLRKEQFALWHNEPFDEDSFPSMDFVINKILQNFPLVELKH